MDLPATYFVEVIEDGIFLTGGGALLRGMRERIAETTRVDVHVGPDPMGAAVHGARAMLPAISAMKLWKA
jgi:rod shape-determining protein MreB